MGMIEKIEASKFIGMEFATWLLWLSHKMNGRIKLEGKEAFDLYFESPVQLFADVGDATVATLKGSLPIDSPEAHLALQEGKLIAKAAMRMNYRNQSYTFTLDASRMTLSALKVPMPANVTKQDYLYVRLERIQEFEEFFDKLFDSYLEIRCDEKEWLPVCNEITEWIDGLHDHGLS